MADADISLWHSIRSFEHAVETLCELAQSSCFRMWVDWKPDVLSFGRELAKALMERGEPTEQLMALLTAIGTDGVDDPPADLYPDWGGIKTWLWQCELKYCRRELTLDEGQLLILCALAAKGSRYTGQIDLEAATDVSRRTIGERMPSLLEAGLVKRKRARGGYAIAADGIKKLKVVPLSARARDVLNRTQLGKTILREIDSIPPVR